MKQVDDELLQLRDHQHKLTTAQLNQLGDQLLSQATVILLRNQRFYGEVFLQLPHRVDLTLTASFGLTYQNHQIALLYNPQLMGKQIFTVQQLLSDLEHLALHLVFRHPIRYPQTNSLTKIATDLTVNQYVTNPLDNLNLNQFNYRFGLHLPPDQGSNIYLKLLQEAFATHPQLQSMVKKLTSPDTHQKWRSFRQSSGVNGKVSQVIHQAWQNTDSKTRGMMNSNLTQRLNKRGTPRKIRWQRYLKRGVGEVISGSQETPSRFNRRQPYRMDLHGTIPEFWAKINVFVDNSGSMSDQSIAQLLSQLSMLLQHYHPLVTIIGFDQQVHIQAKYRLHSAHQIRYQRFSGGGTSFQSIFNWLKKQSLAELNIILTDGYGENHLNYYHHDQHLLWILTQPKEKFSVKNPRGTVVALPDL